jgi:ADP-ribose pyrophosphatase YjhB (NUDIX family)
MTLEEIAAGFAATLANHTPIIDVEVQWPSARLHARTYLAGPELPPELVTSARAVVFKGSRVVVVRQNDGVAHIEPGGGIEPGESVEDAVRREVLEETGWSLGPLTPLGFHHFRPLGEPVPNFRFRWGDFVHPLFVAEALAYDRRARDMAQIEIGSRLTPIRQALAEIEPWRVALLEAAVARRSGR